MNKLVLEAIPQKEMPDSDHFFTLKILTWKIVSRLRLRTHSTLSTQHKNILINNNNNNNNKIIIIILKYTKGVPVFGFENRSFWSIRIGT